ncbi:MAG: flippase-like domain-containing protein [Chitinophagaceae bacterium]|nr:MAG: flippase-like domain-containing protein [Chitinophagaceae bacterium]
MLSKSTKIILNYIFGIGLFVWLSYSMYHQLRYKDNLHISAEKLRQSVGAHQVAIIIVFMMMILNWGIEAWKWKVLINPLEKISFRRSFYAILSGVSFSVNTPNHIGEYGGRILYLRGENRLQAISATFVGSISQFITTLLFGCLGLIFFATYFGADIHFLFLPVFFWKLFVLFCLLMVATLAIFLYFRLTLIVRLFGRVKWLRRFQKYVVVMAEFPPSMLLKVMLLSMLRYLIFSAQYLILLEIMGVEMLWWQGWTMIFLIYLVMAMIPSVTIAELGIRGEVGLYFLGLLSANKIGIIAGTLGIWLINLVIPAIFGSLLLLGIKVLNEGKMAVILKKQHV